MTERWLTFHRYYDDSRIIVPRTAIKYVSDMDEGSEIVIETGSITQFYSIKESSDTVLTMMEIEQIMLLDFEPEDE